MISNSKDRHRGLYILFPLPQTKHLHSHDLGKIHPQRLSIHDVHQAALTVEPPLFSPHGATDGALETKA